MTGPVDEVEAMWAIYDHPRSRRDAIERWWKTQEGHHPGLGLEALFAKRERKAHAAGYRAGSRIAEPPQPSQAMFAVRIDRDGDAYVFRVEPSAGTTEMVAIDSVPGVIAFVAASDPGGAAQRAWNNGETEWLALARLGGKRALVSKAEPPQPASVGGVPVVCQWCGDKFSEHDDARAPDAPVPRMPCLGLRANFVARLAKPAEPPHPSNEPASSYLLAQLKAYRFEVTAAGETYWRDAFAELERRLTVKPLLREAQKAPPVSGPGPGPQWPKEPPTRAGKP